MNFSIFGLNVKNGFFSPPLFFEDEDAECTALAVVFGPFLLLDFTLRKSVFFVDIVSLADDMLVKLSNNEIAI